MVARIVELTDPAAAAAYYEADDYYTGDAKAPSRWQGRGARALGLNGEVEHERFAAMLEGQLPNGVTLGTTRHGRTEHKLGWDLTMSAPKSVSVLALVAGDRRLLDAHDHAVTVALDYAERHGAVTRIRDGKKIERVATDSLVAATFPHFTARATEDAPPDPQLHTHCVIINATQRDGPRDGGGAWRSLESQPLYQLQMDIGAVYHQQLAAEAMRLGYTATIDADSTFKLDAVPDDVALAFSGRSAQIEAALAKRGKTRATASAAQKATIALDTRAPKEAVDHKELAAAWRTCADALGFGEDVRRGIVVQAQARAAEQPTLGTAARMRAADRALADAAEHVAERDSVFTAAALEREAGHVARGHATHADIVTAIVRAERAQDLVIRAAPRMASGTVGYTTRTAIATEQRLLAHERAGRARFAPLHDRIEASRIVAAAELAAATHGHSWTEGQRTATRGLLLSSSAITGVQGSAGTAKTTTVLSTYADAARAQGYEVHALADTSTAAAVLGRAIRADHMTVAMLLTKGDDTAKPGRTVYLVDEATMLCARQTDALFVHAAKVGARLVLVGDVDQLGSVGAGRAFGQLQDAGMPTFVLDQIVRQTNARTREAVEAMLAGDAKAAFEALDAGGGRVVEQPDAQTRVAVIARDFAALSPEDRADTLVLDPTREGRQNLTDAIRVALVADGTLGDEAITATVLEPRGLSRAHARHAANYTPGDILTFREGAKGKPRPGIGYRIDSVDAEAGTVRLVPPRGKTHDWHPARWGSTHAEAFTEVSQEFRTGDKLQFTRNNYRAERRNGDTAMVVAIDPQGSSVLVEKDDGERQMLDLRHLADRHIRPGWVRTIHSSQGATCDRVMAHLESFRANTVDTRAAYVAISRARDGATIYTDSRARLTKALGLRDGAQVGAIDATMGRERDITTGLGLD
ncbi:MobF family relaxase [Sphingomonas bacterium]|uniref:MobF family relaxase n=1 Tax=Sphingomonas bacterium TaxID=1895847 RepID=UPI0015768828|nr:MobF family relaxase [Sphingomonas bacterium]